MAVLVVVLLWVVVPIVYLIARAAAHGWVYTGVTGLDAYDQYQYLAWVRDIGDHGLASNLLGLAGSHVFVQPMYLISGVLWRLGLGLQLSALIWAPIAAIVLVLGVTAYARRWEVSRGRQVAVMVLAVGFVLPLAWFSLPHRINPPLTLLLVSEASLLLQTWLAPHTALTVGVFPLVLLGAERILTAPSRPSVRSRLVVLTAVGAALVSWLHSWQGAELLVVLCGVCLIRRPRRSDLPLLVPVVACAVPLLYQWVLSRTDPAWQLATRLNQIPGVNELLPALVVLAPLLALGAVAVIRRRPRGDGERMVLLWIAAVALVYWLDPEFPPHALQGVTLPLAVLAVRAWPHGRRFAVLGIAAIGALVLPGAVYYAKGLPPAVRVSRAAYYLTADEHAALNYLARSRDPGPVLAPFPMYLVIPAFTDRRVWAGHEIWTPPARYLQLTRFYTGPISARESQQFVRMTGVRYVIWSCVPGGSFPQLAAITTIASTVRHFGCVVVIGLE